jgi:predicted nucleic acid-binding Zn ribbon protein
MINYKVTRREDYITGHMFGNIEFLEDAEYKIDPKYGKRRREAKFKCFCGTEFTTSLSVIKRGVTKSCGCYNKEIVKEINTRHGLSKHPLYGIWQDMKNRCGNKNTATYKWYGAKGISVCDNWKNDIVPFYTWCIEHGWKPGLSIDRINNKENYCPENCKLSTDKEQARNKTNTIFIEHEGKFICLSEYCELIGSNYPSVRTRLRKYKWSLEKAISTERRIDKLIKSYETEPEYSI